MDVLKEWKTFEIDREVTGFATKISKETMIDVFYNSHTLTPYKYFDFNEL